MWNEETAAEVDRRFRDSDERVDEVELLARSLAGDVHGIRTTFDEAIQRWTAHLETDAMRRAQEADAAKQRATVDATFRSRTTLMWAGYIALVAAAIITTTSWLVKRELDAFDARGRAVRLSVIEVAMERVPTGEAYRLESGHPRVRAVQSLVPDDVRGIRRNEVIAICINRPRLCEP